MADHILWPSTELTILENKMSEALKALTGEVDEGEDARNAVIQALEEEGFEATQATDQGGLVIYNSDWGELDDPESDATLKALIGIVTPDSFVSGYDDDGVYWQLRYTESSRSLVYGTVVFPPDPNHKYLLEIETA